jgi:nitrogen regulatory protein P-II 1
MSVMKKIAVLITPATLETVVAALVRLGVSGITLTGIRGRGQQNGPWARDRGSGSAADALATVKLEVLARDEHVEEIIGTIRGAVRTGRTGAGMIGVWPVEAAVRARTRDGGEPVV